MRAEVAMPMPTPAKCTAEALSRPPSRGRSSTRLAANTNTKALATPPAKRNSTNAVTEVVIAMTAVVAALAERPEHPVATRSHGDGQNPEKRPREIAGIVGGRDNSGLALAQPQTIDHEREDRRIDEAANPDRGRQRNEARQGKAKRGGLISVHARSSMGARDQQQDRWREGRLCEGRMAISLAFCRVLPVYAAHSTRGACLMT